MLLPSANSRSSRPLVKGLIMFVSALIVTHRTMPIWPAVAKAETMELSGLALWEAESDCLGTFGESENRHFRSQE